MLITPAILTNSTEILEKNIKTCEGLVDKIQIDIVDGLFADNKTIGVEALENINTTLAIDLHLMVKNPGSWVNKILTLGVDLVVAQVEMMENQEEYVKTLLLNNLQTGLALDLFTDVTAISEEVLPTIDMILLMSVPAGFQSQSFSEKVLEKIAYFNKKREEGDFTYQISVDGGITDKNIKEVLKLGADEVIVGSFLFNGDFEENLRSLKNIL